MNSPKFRVGICGGGISGLCLAVALSKYPDVKVDLYEAAERFTEIGAGVMIWAKTWRILELLGLDAEFSKIAHSPPDGSLGVGFDFRRSDQLEEGSRFHLFEVPYGCIRFHRADFLDVFVNHLQPGIAHFGKRLVTYSKVASDSSIQLQFSDGSTAPCDVLVGCDGIKSLIRAQLYETIAKKTGRPELLDMIDPIWSGTIAYRGLIPLEQMPRSFSHRVERTPTMFCGKGKHVVSYSISQGRVINVVAFSSEPEKEGTPFDGPWVHEVSRQELLDRYAGWEPEVQSLLECVGKPTRWAIHQLKPLPFYANDRVTLLGDAAHAMNPNQGAGAGNAIEDAFFLAEIFGDALTTSQTLPLALKAYEHVRIPMATHVLNGSRDACHMYEFNGPHGEDYAKLGPAIQHQWDWVWASTPEEDVRRGLDWLKVHLRIPSNKDVIHDT